MIHVILTEKEIEHLIVALNYTLNMLKEKAPENGHYFSPQYQGVKDKLEAIQKAIDNQKELKNEVS